MNIIGAREKFWSNNVGLKFVFNIEVATFELARFRVSTDSVGLSDKVHVKYDYYSFAKLFLKKS